jgi:hypothetical protein
MTHRDELEALRARIETQEKDLSDARAELDLLRASVHRQAAANAAPPPGAMGFGPGAFQGPGEARRCGGLRPELSRQLGVLMVLSSLLVGGLFVAMSIGPRGRHRYAPPAAAAAPAPEAAWSPFVRFGHVVAPGDPVAVAEGSACAVEVLPAAGGGDLDCRIVVRCDERLIYGASDMTGFAHCGAVPSFVVDERTSDDDGDPAMTLDLASGRVTVEERVGLSIQRVEIALDPITGT